MGIGSAKRVEIGRLIMPTIHPFKIPLLEVRRLLLGVTGSIATFKAAVPVSMLAQAGAQVGCTAYQVRSTISKYHCLLSADRLLGLSFQLKYCKSNKIAVCTSRFKCGPRNLPERRRVIDY